MCGSDCLRVVGRFKSCHVMSCYVMSCSVCVMLCQQCVVEVKGFDGDAGRVIQPPLQFPACLDGLLQRHQELGQCQLLLCPGPHVPCQRLGPGLCCSPHRGSPCPARCACPFTLALVAWPLSSKAVVLLLCIAVMHECGASAVQYAACT